MLKFFYPAAYYKSVYDIPLDMLKKSGIKGLVFDVDNTLSPHNQAEPDNETIDFIKKTLDSGFKVCLLSNNSAKRVELFNEKLMVHSVSRAFKPSRKGLRKALALLQLNEAETVIIGDQIFTDVWCGKRANVRTILVEPYAEEESALIKLKRRAERFILKSYLKRAREL
jgi:hypothetical protein